MNILGNIFGPPNNSTTSEYKGSTMQEVTNARKALPKSADVTKKVQPLQLQRQRQDALNWRLATQQAESIHFPNRTELTRVYYDVVLDPHLTSLMQNIQLKIQGSKYWICNSNGDINEDATKLIHTKWFSDTLKYIILSKFYGFSYVQLGPVNDQGFEWVKLIPFEYGYPEVWGLKQSPNVLTDPILVREAPYDNWVCAYGEQKDLGILHKASPYVLWKKNTMQAWSEFTDKFGMPLVIGKTNIQDPEKSENMQNMLNEMGKSFWALLDETDNLELQQGNGTDAYQVYQQLINMADSQMSKMIIGQTMTVDNGSSRSQAEVHENTYKDIIAGYKQYIEDSVLAELIPKMITHGLIPQDSFFKFDDAEHMSKKETAEFITKLSSSYTVDPEYIEDNYGFAVVPKSAGPSPEENQRTFQNLKNYYDNALNSMGKPCEH